jgi:ubiquitin carboxyl-terminal hydrolase 8
MTTMYNNDFFYKKGLCGLINLGNTCFMNSIIQCLSSNHEFCKLFITNDFKEYLNTNNSDYMLIEQWVMLIRKIYNRNSTIKPQDFYNTFLMISNDKNIYIFNNFNQNDSQEFLQFFIETIHNGLSRNVIMNITGEAENDLDRMAIKAFESWKKYFKNDFSIIIEMFYGQFISNIKCNDDDIFSSNTYEPFSNISLEIPKYDNKTINIYDCFDKFTEIENLDEFKQNDEDNQSYTKKLNIWNTPNYLVIFFKRFDTNNSKILDLIEFPINGLDLNKYVTGYDKDNNIFDLHAISNHSGSSDGGHYWAYTKNADGLWYKYDDDCVTHQDIEQLITPNAYCLFYKKNN